MTQVTEDRTEGQSANGSDHKPTARAVRERRKRTDPAALERLVWFALVLAFIGMGVLAGGPLADWAGRYVTAWTERSDLTFFKLGIHVVTALVAFLAALRGFRLLVQSVTYLEEMPLLDKAAASIGVLLGLSVSLLATVPFASLEGIGLPIRICVVLLFVPAGILFALAAKDQMVYVFPWLATPAMDGRADVLPEGAKCLDTNIIIDGRIVDIATTGFLGGMLLVPGFVLRELRQIADSADEVKRARGKRGLEVLNRLQSLPGVQVVIYEDYPDTDKPEQEVDVRLVSLARARNAAVLTNDHGVAQLARLQGVQLLNVNELAQALRPAYLPGEEFVVTIVKEGKEPGQGVGYLDDGTMIVVEGASKHLGKSVPVAVTSTLQTSAGKMIFADINVGQAARPKIAERPARKA